MNKRLKCVLAGELVALGFVLAFLPSAVDAWTSVHLSATVVCIEGYSRADITAENSESEAAHVLAETGGAWVVGDDIPKPSQTKGVSISGPVTFQVTVNYPSDGTPRPSNSVTVNPIHGCEPTTTTSSTSTSSTSTSTSSTSTSTTIPETTTTRPTTTTTECVRVGGQVTSDHDTTTTSTIPSVTTVCTARDVGSACDTTTRPSTTVAPTAPQMSAAVPATPRMTG